MQVQLAQTQIRYDGRPELVLAGEIHYFRLDRDTWADRLDLLVAAGADTVASYIPWVVHEQPDGSIDLTGRTRPELDLGAFIDLAAAKGLRFLARPGPFTMAELRHEGVPGRVADEHPELRPVGWDAAPAPTSTLDYLGPAFLAETRRWYQAVGGVLAPRMAPAGGPVTMVQLDNEVGMLAWVSNTPDLTDHLVADFRSWVESRYGGDALAARYPSGLAPEVVRSPLPAVSGALRHDLTSFMRDRFACYVDALADMAVAAGFGGVPFLINVHGTEAGGAASFPIGIAQLLETWRGRPDRTAGSDHYVGTLTWASAAELHLVHAFLDATLDGQPLTSLEFEVGTGDYGGDEGAFTDPSAVVLKTRLLLAQGTRLFNAYLFAGGENRLDPRDDDAGTHRFGITGQRHGSAAPVDPDGRPGPSYPSTVESLHVARAHARWAATWRPEYDDVTVGFVPDHYATEYVYRGNPVMPDIADELRHARGAGPGGVLARALLGAGVRYRAVDLGRDDVDLGRVLVLGSPGILGSGLQHRLADHVRGGGGLLLVGALPSRDDDGSPCTVLADALGLRAGATLTGADLPFASVVGDGWLAGRPEVRVGRMQTLEVADGAVLLREVMSGRPVAAEVTTGDGRAVVVAADVALPPDLMAQLIDRLGGTVGLTVQRDVPGVLVTTTRTPDGDRFLHVLSVAGYPATVRVALDGEPLCGGEVIALSPRTGRILPVDVGLAGHRVSATAEIAGWDGATLTLAASGAVWVDGRRIDLDGAGPHVVRLVTGQLGDESPTIHRVGSQVPGQTDAGS